VHTWVPPKAQGCIQGEQQQPVYGGTLHHVKYLCYIEKIIVKFFCKNIFVEKNFFTKNVFFQTNYFDKMFPDEKKYYYWKLHDRPFTFCVQFGKPCIF